MKLQDNILYNTKFIQVKFLDTILIWLISFYIFTYITMATRHGPENLYICVLIHQSNECFLLISLGPNLFDIIFFLVSFKKNYIFLNLVVII